jgi:anaerobic magnesium-protoporphyrin IX monomethyl ester cyclase
MRIQIVNPNLSGDVSILDIGQTYLTTFLAQRTRHPATTLDFTFHRRDWREHLRRRLDAFEPDVLGVSSTSLYMRYVTDIIAEAKAHRPSLRVILGGWHVSLLPEDSIARPHVEAIVLGDGEYTCAEYLDAVEEQRPLDNIAGLWFKRDGEVVRNIKRPFIADVDELPVPDYDCWEDIEKYVYYNQMMYFMGNRGCPYACTYCSEVSLRQAIPGKGIRRRSPRLLAREIQQQHVKYRDAGMRIAHFFDPVFPFNKRWTEEFCDEYRALGLADVLPFSCFARGDTLDAERVETLARGGCKLIRIGIEAGNERIRREVYDKQISNDQLREIFRLCHANGIALTGYNMLGGPGEDLGTMIDTFRLVRELRVDRPIFFTYRPLPATRGAELVAEMGGHVLEEGWESIDSLHTRSNVETGKLRPWQIEWFRNFCLAYFNGKRTLRLIARQRHRFLLNFIEYTLRGLRDGLALQYIVGYFMVCAGDNLTS